MEIKDQLKLSREEQFKLEPTVRLDTSGAALLNGVPPEDNPRVYNMTDAEALEWNKRKAAETNKE